METYNKFMEEGHLRINGSFSQKDINPGALLIIFAGLPQAFKKMNFNSLEMWSHFLIMITILLGAHPLD